MMHIERDCWCGCTDMQPFSAEYRRCAACGTLVSRCGLSESKLAVTDDSKDFYGRNYWEKHQGEDFGYPDIMSRLRTDLTERNLHWLSTLLAYCPPPASVLELGCAHGSFVHLMQAAGYAAQGVEMSPWVVELGRRTFSVPLHVGPLEALDIPAGSLDCIAMMDVLEHLHRPEDTLRHCLSLLKPDGILLIQTPETPTGLSHEEMQASQHPFLIQFKADEHLHLLDRNAVVEMLARAGAQHVCFEPAIFSQYDMYLVAGRTPPARRAPAQFEPALQAAPAGRLVQAMLDLYRNGLDMARDRDYHQHQAAILKADKMPGTVAVDLTPLLVGGENGGAKIFMLTLLSALARLLPDTRFILLTRASAHDHLRYLDADNVCRRIALDDHVARPALASRLKGRIPARLRRVLRKLRSLTRPVPSPVASNHSTLLESLGADLLYCPFTAPTMAQPSIPTVCTIYDLQYKTYPQFFSPQDRQQRDQQFSAACTQASLLVSISDYTRQSALEHGAGLLTPDRIRTIPIRTAHRLHEGSTHPLPESLGLTRGRYFLYPANFWPHKNHEMLLTAFSMACHNGLPADFKLVCTGALDAGRQTLAQAAQRMGLQERVLFPGYVAEEGLAGLLHHAGALVFPSLYEGFGMPVIEAMAAGIPVACSNQTSLPEIAGKAALLFDPRVPTDIETAMLRLAHDDALRNSLIRAGQKQAEPFLSSERMAREYKAAFIAAMGMRPQTPRLVGVHADGWTSNQLTFGIPPAAAPRTLELSLSAPDWLPVEMLHIHASPPLDAQASSQTLHRGHSIRLCWPVAPEGGNLVVKLTPAFVPARHGMGADTRELAARFEGCRLLDGQGNVLHDWPAEPLA